MIPKTFWQKVNKCGPNDCWEWLGDKTPCGYGRIKSQGKKIRAHRVAFFLANGHYANPYTCHKCDNPSCCNPNHLFEGNDKDNMADMAAKWRHGLAKLNKNDVIEIRNSLKIGVSKKSLAKRFGVAPAAIRRIAKGLTYRHVGEQ